MAGIEWSDSYSVNHKLLDEQHKELVMMIDDLQNAMSNSNAASVVGRIIDKLIDYTKVHFTTEERLLQAGNFPDFEAHKNEHIELANRVMEFKKKYESGGFATTFELIEFLSDWLIQHILESDKRYAGFLKD